MSRIAPALESMRRNSRTALAPYLVAGDPRPEATVPCMRALVDAGADLIELGVPFSDPMAEGPVIQARARARLSPLRRCGPSAGMVAEFRAEDARTPVVLTGYTNSLSRKPPKVFSLPYRPRASPARTAWPRKACAPAWRSCVDAPTRQRTARAFGASAGAARRQLADASLKGRLSVCRDADAVPETRRAAVGVAGPIPLWTANEIGRNSSARHSGAPQEPNAGRKLWKRVLATA